MAGTKKGTVFATKEFGHKDPVSPLLEPEEMIRNRWKVLKKLGGGGFGEIFEAFDNQEEKNVAIKTEALTDRKDVRSFPSAGSFHMKTTCISIISQYKSYRG